MENENRFCLYFHINSFTEEVFYVGIGTGYRPYSKRNRNIHWIRTVNKFGYIVKIIEENISAEEAKKGEIFFINYFGRRDNKTGNLVNMTDGGDGISGCICTEETAKKISIANTGKKQSEERISKRVESFKRKMKEEGYVFWAKNSVQSDEHKSKISEANKGKTKSYDHKTRLSESKKKYYETNAHPWIGRSHSEETKQKIKDKRALQKNNKGPKKGSIP